MIRGASRWLIALVVLLLTAPLWAAISVVVGTDPTKTVIKGTLVTPDQVLDGELVIEGDTITCVAANCTAPTGATRITATNAYIFPGFVDGEVPACAASTSSARASCRRHGVARVSGYSLPSVLTENEMTLTENEMTCHNFFLG